MRMKKLLKMFLYKPFDMTQKHSNHDFDNINNINSCNPIDDWNIRKIVLRELILGMKDIISFYKIHNIRVIEREIKQDYQI
jgi:hypothetical protein